MASREEVILCLAYLSSAAGKGPSEEQAEVYIDLLGDLPADVLMVAVKRSALLHRYPSLPPVGLIRQQAAELLSPPVPPAEAWRLVRDLVRRFGPDPTRPIEMRPEAARLERERRRLAALAAVPAAVLAAGRAYGWAMLDGAADDDTTAFAQFRDVYTSLDGPARREAALPPAVRAPTVAALAGRIGMPGLTNGEA